MSFVKGGGEEEFKKKGKRIKTKDWWLIII